MSLRVLPVTLLGAATLFLVCACGSDNDNDAISAVDNTGGEPDTSEEESSGRFVDSGVAGLAFQTPTHQGLTDSDGAFTYLPGEDVVFSIGSVELPPVAGAELVTPFTVFDTEDFSDTRVINLTRLLQSLDVDGNPDNGIVISDAAIANAAGLDVDFSSPDFDASVGNLVANSGSLNTSLITGESALTHFQETLFIEGVMERPEAPTGTETTGDDTPDATTTHPLVGTSREFTTRAHGVSGTVTVLDDRTLQITNFIYDGGGPSVFFYTGIDNDYSSDGSGRIIGDQLNGREYDNETLTITLPDDLTLDDFNALSVWCDIFFVSFGDVSF